MEQISEYRCFGGRQLRFRHQSDALHCSMVFSVYLPPQAAITSVPVLYWLSGLTCTDENFVTKAGAQRYAAEHGVAVVAPDTSPRGEGVPDDPNAAYDFGLGAGFYVNATEQPWAKHYRMYDYIVSELPELIAANFPIVASRSGIFGHSMGGHGALVIALRNPDRFKSVSAFSPIVAPGQVPWGRKALSGYLGDDEGIWRQYDSVALIDDGRRVTRILVDQGDKDEFLAGQLKPELLESACAKADIPLTLRLQSGYDHSYYFISTFIGEHVRWHADALK